MIRLRLFKQYVFFIVFSTISMTAFSEKVIHPFVSGSFSQILEQRQQQSFVLVLWSLDCPSCYKELEMLGKLNSRNTGLNIVLVSIRKCLPANVKLFVKIHVKIFYFSYGINISV